MCLIPLILIFFNIGVLTYECNFSGYVDRIVFGPNYCMYPCDPEGMISTLNSFFNVYIGLIYCLIFKKYKGEKLKLFMYWIAAGNLLTIIGLSVGVENPINKKIWSISFMILTPGLSGISLALLYFIIDIFFEKYEKLKYYL